MGRRAARAICMVSLALRLVPGIGNYMLPYSHVSIAVWLLLSIWIFCLLSVIKWVAVGSDWHPEYRMEFGQQQGG